MQCYVSSWSRHVGRDGQGAVGFGWVGLKKNSLGLGLGAERGGYVVGWVG